MQEIVKTASPASVATVPAHYWEDALRHSVYLTLVRDKIDQLIAKSAVKSENSKPEPAIKEDDERDMWKKIKNAPFDRLVEETTTPIGDINILAKGRLLEENGGYRFAEDETTKEKCVDEKCRQGVKAFWSVKRVRQRDAETQPGKYHYELTFSVTSQSLEKEKILNNNKVRTFTVRESPRRDPDHINYAHRPQRAVWVHKNIVPPKHHETHHRNHGLDRFFSSLFSDEDTYDLPRYKQQNVFAQQQIPQLSKVGNVGSFGDPRKLIPYPYKPQPYKHQRYPPPTQPSPIIRPYIDFEKMFNNPYSFPHGDYKMLPSNVVKTTRPAFLPTPVMPLMPVSVANKINFSTDLISKWNITETVTKEPQYGTTYKSHSKPKPTPVRVSYFTDYVRPPIFNAPPGVFVTMDNKPFKPMPPLKFFHHSKSKPIDFRPSPQILGDKFSDPDSLPESVFKPISLGYSDNTTAKNYFIENNKKRKLSSSNRKPSNASISTKSLRTTTVTPDIITAHNDFFDENDTTEWVNLLGAFSKTTPMASFKIKSNTTASPIPTTTTPIPTTKAMEPEVVSITTTTAISTKRTRPPPKLTKQSKLKKHKRVTTSTTTTTTTTTSAPQNTTLKTTTEDLNPQASSAATNDKITWKHENKTLSTTPVTTLSSTNSTTTTQPTTTIKQSTTTAQTTSTTITSTISTTPDVESPSTTQPKYKNRYRQSTLMHKGTSVKHDRWSGLITEKNKSDLTYKSSRRNESNFQGYSSHTLKSQNVEQNKQHQRQNSTLPPKVRNSNENITTQTESTSLGQSEYENSVDQYTTSSEIPTAILNDRNNENPKENQTKHKNEEDIKDQNEYIFNLTSTSVEKSNEIDDNVVTTEQIIITTPQTVARNKPRCKKKKHNNTATITKKDHNNFQHEVITNISSTTTENSFSSGFFDELLRSFDTDITVDAQPKPPLVGKIKQENASSGRFKYIEDDFGDLLDSLEDNHKHYNEKSEEIYEDSDRDTSLEYSPFNNEEENHAARASNDEYTDYQDHPYTLFELMAME